MDIKDVKLFIAIPNDGRTPIDHDNEAVFIRDKFNSCFKILGYHSKIYSFMIYDNNVFNDISQAIDKINDADIIIVSNKLQNNKNSTLFNMIIDSNKSSLSESQLNTVMHCYNVVEDCLI
jgi:hypothetical protein